MVGEISPVPGITIRTAYEFGGKSYNTEREAITAIIAAELGNPGIAAAVVQKHATLYPMFRRLQELEFAER